MRKITGGALVAAVAFGLVACGSGATVDNQKADQATVAPLSKATKASTSGTATATPTGTEQPSRAAGAPAAPAPRDGAAQEITALPSQGAKRTDKQTKYLETLTKQGIKVEGVEDQLFGTAADVCTKGKDSVLPGVAAGQLVEQRRTEKKPDEVASIISQAAKDGFC